jgi:hypothetical protein
MNVLLPLTHPSNLVTHMNISTLTVVFHASEKSYVLCAMVADAASLRLWSSSLRVGWVALNEWYNTGTSL